MAKKLKKIHTETRIKNICNNDSMWIKLDRMKAIYQKFRVI